MKRKAMLILCFLFLFIWWSELLLAGEEKRLNITIRDGKVSADIYQIPIREVVSEIGKKWGIIVEVYGKVDQDRLIYTQFEDLPLREGLDRVLRGTNFVYTENGKLYLLGFGDPSSKKEASHTSIITISSAQTANPGKGSPSASGSSSRKGGTDQAASGSRVSGVRKESDADNRTNLVGGRWEVPDGRMGTPGTSGEIQNLGEVNRGRDSRSTSSTSFTTPIILEATGQAISAISNDIVYDPNLLANPTVNISDSAKHAGKEVVFNEVRPGLLRVGVVGLNQNLIPDGVTANVTFDVLKGGQISFTNQPTASDPHGNKVLMIFKDGKITLAK
jgi:hypothetical protein